MSLPDILLQKPNATEVSLKSYEGSVLLIVNTATKCGLAPQFHDLEVLWSTYSSQGLVVLGFPCGQFANQEPGTSVDTEQVCQRNFGVSFPLFAKVDVNGTNAHPLYTYLKSQKGGWLSRSIKWNFTKFLIDHEGVVIKRYAPTVSPLSIQADIELLLARRQRESAK